MFAEDTRIRICKTISNISVAHLLKLVCFQLAGKRLKRSSKMTSSAPPRPAQSFSLHQEGISISFFTSLTLIYDMAVLYANPIFILVKVNSHSSVLFWVFFFRREAYHLSLGFT